MTFPLRRSPSLRRAALVSTAVALPAVIVVALGVRLAMQDRELQQRRDRDLLQVSLRAAAQHLELSMAQGSRAALEGASPPGLVRFIFDAGGMRPDPVSAVLWVPQPPVLPDAEAAELDEVEAAEFSGRFTEAATRYAVLARSERTPIQAGALVRLARIARRSGRWHTALDAYAQLAALTGVSIEGAPADLQARRARCDLLHSNGSRAELERELRQLEHDWHSGRWMVDEVTWSLLERDVERWTGRAPDRDRRREQLSGAADALWALWRDGTRISADARSIGAGQDRVVIWMRDSTGYAVTASDFSTWIARAGAAASLPEARLTLTTTSGEWLGGSGADGVQRATATSTETGLPWTMALSTESTLATAGRGQLFGLVLAVLVLVVAGSGYALWRLVRRELAIVRLQSEFVAAVSHEFRTPLTSLRHVTELLEERDDLPPERRRAFYGALGRSTDRLQRLVESLLDFSRLDAGRATCDLRPVDAAEIVSTVVSGFRTDLDARGLSNPIDLAADRPAPISGDVAALSLALWNLLDNAVKYSAAGAPVRVAVFRSQGDVVITVRDRGHGIPAGEQGAIFGRFVRGALSRRLGITGTGLGLAIVSHVVQAHHGRVTVESTEGHGSEFRMHVPAAAAAERPSAPEEVHAR